VEKRLFLVKFPRKEETMKTKSIYLVLAIFVLLGSGFTGPTWSNLPGMIRLTAEQVSSAQDIEAATHQATAWGTRSGTVILDGSLGPFVFTENEGDDRTINIFYSNLALRGENGAILANSDGIFFDDVRADRILIADFSMNCLADCIVSWGNHKDVRIQNMELHAGANGIQIAQTQKWSVYNNKIFASSAAVQVIEASSIKIVRNQLTGYIPISFVRTENCAAVQNQLQGQWQGVLLTAQSSSNMVNRNQIKGVESSGVALEPGAYENMIIRNQVSCAAGAACLTVDADELTLAANHVIGNLP
jgi:hypothetical protein